MTHITPQQEHEQMLEAPELREVSSLPRAVRHIEHVWIPMPDGVRLAAQIWLPEDAGERPVPAILEYVPYRHRDGTVTRDAITHAWYAGHGYAGVRVDIRGSGNSEGVLVDEYTQQELNDGVAILEWLAEQPWCDGRCGMMGISWGGFNALQIAAMQPPQLRAIITLCSTDDRYTDDVHYMGGCLLGDNLSWASVMFAYSTLPPDPAIVGDAWREMWMQRLEASHPWLEVWLSHQARDQYWQHGSVCEDISRIRIPVMAVSGWADAYTNSVFRLLRDLPPDVPRCGLAGPWSHKYPHIGIPGPAIGFLQESLRWWDRHIKGIQTGIDQEPLLRAYMQDSVSPSTGYEHRPGRWVAESNWPSPDVEPRWIPLAADRYGLAMTPRGEPAVDPKDLPVEPLSVCSPFSLGYFGGKWCSETAPPDLPDDQREEDGGALVFDSPPLEQRLEVLGAPIVELMLQADHPVAMVAVRLGDILPDGRITRITYGLLNLTHREGHEHPVPLEPGRSYRIRVQLNDIAQSFPPGHRLRVAISSSYWPLAWLPPHRATLTVHSGVSSLILPIRPIREQEEPTVTLAEPEGAPAVRPTVLEHADRSWRVIRDLAEGRSMLEVRKGKGVLYWPEIDWQRSSDGYERYEVDHDDIHSARGIVHWTKGFARGDWTTRIETHTVLTGDANNFHIEADLDAFVGERRIFARTWSRDVPRHFV